MMARTGTRSQVVTQAFLPGVVVAFHQDGTATWTAAHCFECSHCGAYNDQVGDTITLPPNEAWGLLQAAHRYLPVAAWREVARAILDAINGPQD